MVETAEPSDRGGTTDGLHWSVKRSILAQRAGRRRLSPDRNARFRRSARFSEMASDEVARARLDRGRF
jgi:hypothetical protein